MSIQRFRIIEASPTYFSFYDHKTNTDVSIPLSVNDLHIGANKVSNLYVKKSENQNYIDIRDCKYYGVNVREVLDINHGNSFYFAMYDKDVLILGKRIAFVEIEETCENIEYDEDDEDEDNPMMMFITPSGNTIPSETRKAGTWIQTMRNTVGDTPVLAEWYNEEFWIEHIQKAKAHNEQHDTVYRVPFFTDKSFKFNVSLNKQELNYDEFKLYKGQETADKVFDIFKSAIDTHYIPNPEILDIHIITDPEIIAGMFEVIED